MIGGETGTKEMNYHYNDISKIIKLKTLQFCHKIVLISCD